MITPLPTTTYIVQTHGSLRDGTSPCTPYDTKSPVSQHRRRPSRNDTAMSPAYLLPPDEPPEAAPPPALETLRHLLSESPAPLTRQEILVRWPQGEPPPSGLAPPQPGA